MAADLLAHLMPALLLAAEAAPDAAKAAAEKHPAAGELSLPLAYTVLAGLVSISVGILLCLFRIWRGPTLADRVLASDVLALHVIGFVVLLTIYLGDLTFFDAVLGVAIVGFASTVGFAQFIGAGGDEATSCVPDEQPAPTPEPAP